MNLLKNQRAAETIDSVYVDLEAQLMQNIARHLRDWEKPIDTDKWLIQKLAEIGKLNQENIKIIAEMSGLSQTAAERMLNEVADEAIKNMEPGFRYLARHGLVEGAVDVSKSKNVKQVMKHLSRQAKESLNLTNTTMLHKTQESFKNLVINTADEAMKIMNNNTSAVVTGAESRQQALRKTIRQFNEKGITGFVDKRGRNWTPEAYVNMAMRTTAGSVADEMQTARCKDYGINLIAIDAHSGARPKCAKDQGKIFDLNNKSGTTEDLNGKKIKYYPWNSSSYGEPDGILGINCGHHKFPFVPGVNIQRYFPTDDIDANDKLYKQTQVQRALERDVRKQKRECMLYDEIGDKESFEEAAVKLKAKEATLKNYVDKNPDLHRRKDREQVVGFDKRISSDAVAANKKAYSDFVKKVGKKDAPTFTEYSKAGYTKSKEYKELKALSKYREKVPDANMSHYKLNEALHSKKLIRGNVIPVEKKQVYILEDVSYKRDPAHIMKRMNKRHITDDQVQSYVDNAVLCISQFNGTRRVYYSDDGVTVLTKTSDYGDIEWIAKTTWSKHDFDENTERILKEAKKYVQS